MAGDVCDMTRRESGTFGQAIERLEFHRGDLPAVLGKYEPLGDVHQRQHRIAVLRIHRIGMMKAEDHVPQLVMSSDVVRQSDMMLRVNAVWCPREIPRHPASCRNLQSTQR